MVTVPTRARPRHTRPSRSRQSGPGGTRRRDTRRYAALAVLLYLAVRAVSLLITLWASPHSAGTTLYLLGTHWDSDRYLHIAQWGYGPAPHLPLPHTDQTKFSDLAFFPLLPAVMAGVHAVLPFLPWSAVGPLVSTLASCVAAWGVHAAVATRFGRRVATLTVLLWGMAPAAIIENTAYSESLFTAFAAWALWALVERRWLTAAVLCVLAGLTRPTAVAVIAALVLLAALEVYRRFRGGRDEASEPLWRPVAAAVIAPLGLLGYLTWTGLLLHSPTAYLQLQAQWHSRFDFGASCARDVVRLFTSRAPLSVYYPVDLGVLGVAVLLTGFAAYRRHPPAFLVFSLVTVLLAVGDSAHLASRPRLLLCAFPLLVPVASGLNRLRSRPLTVVVLIAATVASACYCAYSYYISPGAP